MMRHAVAVLIHIFTVLLAPYWTHFCAPAGPHVAAGECAAGYASAVAFMLVVLLLFHVQQDLEECLTETGLDDVFFVPEELDAHLIGGEREPGGVRGAIFACGRGGWAGAVKGRGSLNRARVHRHGGRVVRGPRGRNPCGGAVAHGRTKHHASRTRPQGNALALPRDAERGAAPHRTRCSSRAQATPLSPRPRASPQTTATLETQRAAGAALGSCDPRAGSHRTRRSSRAALSSGLAASRRSNGALCRRRRPSLLECASPARPHHAGRSLRAALSCCLIIRRRQPRRGATLPHDPAPHTRRSPRAPGPAVQATVTLERDAPQGSPSRARPRPAGPAAHVLPKRAALSFADDRRCQRARRTAGPPLRSCDPPAGPAAHVAPRALLCRPASSSADDRARRAAGVVLTSVTHVRSPPHTSSMPRCLVFRRRPQQSHAAPFALVTHPRGPHSTGRS